MQYATCGRILEKEEGVFDGIDKMERFDTATAVSFVTCPSRPCYATGEPHVLQRPSCLRACGVRFQDHFNADLKIAGKTIRLVLFLCAFIIRAYLPHLRMSFLRFSP